MSRTAEFDKKIERENITAWDWVHAERYCRFYLRHRLYDFSKTYHDEARAFTTAIVVTYCRPFSGNRTRDGAKDHIDDQYVQALDKDAKAFHDRIVNLRNGIFAHSDAALHDVQLRATEGGATVTVAEDLLVPLERRDVEALLVNIEVFQEVNQRLLSDAQAARLTELRAPE